MTLKLETKTLPPRVCDPCWRCNPLAGVRIPSPLENLGFECLFVFSSLFVLKSENVGNEKVTLMFGNQNTLHTVCVGDTWLEKKWSSTKNGKKKLIFFKWNLRWFMRFYQVCYDLTRLNSVLSWYLAKKQFFASDLKRIWDLKM